jgi:hypothetical protein
MSVLRFDFIFSYWIFTWFILYLCNITTYNPKFAFIIGLLDNIIILLLMIKHKTNSIIIFNFIIINTIIKLLPIYYLRNELINEKDIYVSVILFFIFIIWLHINNKTLFNTIKVTYNSLIYGTNETPFMNLLKKIYLL